MSAVARLRTSGPTSDTIFSSYDHSLDRIETSPLFALRAIASFLYSRSGAFTLYAAHTWLYLYLNLTSFSFVFFAVKGPKAVS